MLLSMETQKLFGKFTEEEGIAAAAEAGFDALDYSMNGAPPDQKLGFKEAAAHAEKLRGMAEKAGLCFNQAHASFPVYREGEAEFNETMSARVKDEIRVASIIGAKNIIVHPFEVKNGGKYMDAAAQKETNLKFYRELESTALEVGIKIALENLNGWDYDKHCYAPTVCSYAAWLAEYLDELNPAAFTVCLDVGHSNITGEAPDQAIRVLGNKRLTALHIHDNDSFGDAHDLPFTGTIDWYALTKALGEIDYQGDFTYEASNFVGRREAEKLPQALRYMVKLGRNFIQNIDEHRPKKI